MAVQHFFMAAARRRSFGPRENSFFSFLFLAQVSSMHHHIIACLFVFVSLSFVPPLCSLRTGFSNSLLLSNSALFLQASVRVLLQYYLLELDKIVHYFTGKLHRKFSINNFIFTIYFYFPSNSFIFTKRF